MDVSSIIETTSELKVEDNEAVEEESDDCMIVIDFQMHFCNNTLFFL